MRLGANREGKDEGSWVFDFAVLTCFNSFLEVIYRNGHGAMVSCMCLSAIVKGCIKKS